MVNSHRVDLRWEDKMALVDRLLVNPARTIGWLESPEGKEYQAYLLDLLDYNNRELRKASEQKDMFRNQGAIAILETLLTLPALVREHQKARLTKGPDGKMLQNKVEA